MLQPSSSVSSSSSLRMELLKTCLCHVESLLFALCNWFFDKISLYISKTSSSTSWWCFDYKICPNRSKTSSSTSWWCFDVWSLAALPSPCRKFASPQIPLDYSSPFTPLWWGCKHANPNQTRLTKQKISNPTYQFKPMPQVCQPANPLITLHISHQATRMRRMKMMKCVSVCHEKWSLPICPSWEP